MDTNARRARAMAPCDHSRRRPPLPSKTSITKRATGAIVRGSVTITTPTAIAMIAVELNAGQSVAK